MADVMRAADLPNGSVVAKADKAWIKNWPGTDVPWRSTYGSWEHNVHVDEALREGAQVLRVGTGEA